MWKNTPGQEFRLRNAPNSPPSGTCFVEWKSLRNDHFPPPPPEQKTAWTTVLLTLQVTNHVSQLRLGNTTAQIIM